MGNQELTSPGAYPRAASLRPEEALAAALPVSVRELAKAFATAGYRVWAVGGSVRDVLAGWLLGQERTSRGDWDLATDAEPKEVQGLFRRVIPTGIQHGTVTIVHGGEHFEVTTLRGERGHTDGRRPDEVFFVRDLELDLARRDFTVNAIAFDLVHGTLHDPFNGQADLHAKVLRAVGDPLERYREDGLRPLRAARLAAQLEMSLEVETRRSMALATDRFAQVSLERVRDEWIKALKTPAPSRCFELLLEQKLLAVTAPGLFEGTSSAEMETAWRRLDRAAPDPIRRLTHLISCGFASFAVPEKVQRTNELTRHLRLSNREQKRVETLLDSEMEPEDLTSEAARRWLARVERENASDCISYAEERATRPAFLQLAREELRVNAPLSLKELRLSGRDLIEAELVSPGPQVKELLRELLDAVLEDPSLNEHERLLEHARRFAGSLTHG